MGFDSPAGTMLLTFTEMASKSMKPSQPVRREMTEEEKKEQALRAFAQERKALAQSAFAGLMTNPALADFFDDAEHAPQMVADFAVAAADALMARLYGGAEQVKNTEK